MVFRAEFQIAPQIKTDTVSGAALLIESLEAQGVSTIFGYPGGAIMPVYDALPGSNITHILTRHEQGAALAANAYGRVTGRPGVCMATSGPGATNLITGIGDGFLDSVPMVAITGQVGQHLMGTDAFQEADVFGMTLPIVKHSYIIRNPEEIPQIVAEAFEIAQSGRPGPVLIDFPRTVGATKITRVPQIKGRAEQPPAAPAADIARAAQMISEAKKPLLYVGGGVVMGRAVQEFRDLAERTGIPVVSTLKALGTMPSTHPQFIGMMGMHGLKATNLAVQESDLLICCGARFDDRVTGKLDTFAPHAKIIHMDIDPAEINKLRKADIPLVGGIAATLAALQPKKPDIAEWVAKIDAMKIEHAFRYDAPGLGVYAPALLKELSEKAGEKLIVTCDVGQHQMWVAQHCKFIRQQAHLSSGGFGTMGFGLPAAIGAWFAEPDAQVVCVSGDGSIMMNIQELATLRRYGIPVKIVLIDNGALGMVRQWQELFFDGNYSEVDLSDNPDFCEVAKAFGIDAFAIHFRSEVPGAIDRLLASKTACLLHVKINPRENVWPLVPPGKSNTDMMEGSDGY
jgi:acetolactate synthase-1/2/3 large subunit